MFIAYWEFSSLPLDVIKNYEYVGVPAVYSNKTIRAS